MAEFRRAVLTTKGLTLLAKAQTDEVPIVITSVCTGSGTYEEGEGLVERTALKEYKQSFAPTQIVRQNSVNVYIRFSITNNPPGGALEHGYNLTEMGIMANDPDEGEILYAIAVTEPGQSDYLPAYNGQMPAVIGVNFLIEVANADTVIIETDLSAYVTYDELEVLNIRWGGEEESITRFNQDGSITETTSEGTKITIFNQDGTITENYPSGRRLKTTFNSDGSITRELITASEQEEL